LFLLLLLLLLLQLLQLLELWGRRACMEALPLMGSMTDNSCRTAVVAARAWYSCMLRKGHLQQCEDVPTTRKEVC
jgi:hypothetical protein